ncbi:hypothetical protein Cni_G01093 [Canna indica]|uniref:Cystatin domain-containing protein n=1 Tax=Canna indica TaxID=4628 RepID=A0AAQ3JNR9_9LILI|nr:hypothetical protein Cni_G01093 [Canna indica]
MRSLTNLSLLPTLLPLLLLLLSSFSWTAHALTPPRKALPGGWSPIENIKDPYTREIAEFAVCEHNNQLEKTNLTLVKVVRGESQVVAGTNYRLVLQAKDGRGVSAKYEVVVWVQPWKNFRQLTSFHKLVVFGGWTKIKDVSDPHVREIAEFAVWEHNDEAKTCLALIKVVKGETQVVAGTKYRLVLKVRVLAVVLERKWDNFRHLVTFIPL